MAVKILSGPTRPELSQRPKYIRTCPECGCRFEYQFKDCQENNYRGGYISIACPCCGYQVVHSVAGSNEDVNHPVEEM